MVGLLCAYVKGIHRLHPKPFFKVRRPELSYYAAMVCHVINQLAGCIAVTDPRHDADRPYDDYEKMLREVFWRRRR